ncbi:MAG TPA: YopX family protein [Candidatus Obscuribacterales bacterium]
MTQQRTLKFRAWDPEARAMLDEWIFSQDYSYLVPGETIELAQLVQLHELHVMQFTGFYDRSGKEIYEGDVLLSREADTGLEDELFEMYYELGGFCLVDYPRSAESEAYVCYRNWYNAASRGKDSEIPQPSCRFDVVGHIHEPRERIEQRVMQLQDESSLESGVERDILVKTDEADQAYEPDTWEQE